MKTKPIFYRHKKERFWTPAFLYGEQNGIVNIKTQREIDLYYDGIFLSRKEIDIKERKP